MEKGWIDRLWATVDRDGRSLRAISLAAGLGVNYLSQTRTRDTHPASDKLASLLDELGPKASLYVMTGLDLSAEDLAFVKLLSGYTAEQKQAALEVIQAVLAQKAAPEPPPSAAGSAEPTRRVS